MLTEAYKTMSLTINIRMAKVLHQHNLDTPLASLLQAFTGNS